MTTGERVLVEGYPNNFFIIREVLQAKIKVIPNDSKLSMIVDRSRSVQVNFAHFGNGYTFWIPNSSVDVAFIDKNRNISYKPGINEYSIKQKKMVKAYVELVAREDEGTISVTQKQKVLSELSVQDKVVNRIIKLSHNVESGEIMKAAMIYEAFTHYGLKELDSEKFNHHSRLFMDNFIKPNI